MKNTIKPIIKPLTPPTSINTGNHKNSPIRIGGNKNFNDTATFIITNAKKGFSWLKSQ